MSSIPREVLSDHLQDRLAGRRVLGAVFLTFEFDPGFFEEEVLPVILDTPVSQARVPRLLQLEDAVRSVLHGVSVFYDWTGLRISDYGAARLDVHRFPVRVGTGIFHPKNILLLTEDADADEDGLRRRHLLVATLSANLTRSGWWENVEACHVEEIDEGSATRLKEPLVTLLQRVERLTANPAAREVLRPYRQFLGALEQGAFKSRGGRLLPHFYVCGGGEGDDLDAFLRHHIPRDRGYRLEVISPFFDKHPSSSPLKALVKATNPDEVRVYLPVDLTGAAQCSEELYQYVRATGDHVEWGCLPDDLLALGRHADAGRRGVHAKVYRIFKPHPKTEFIFLGSANLTAPGHSGRGGNIETGMLLQLDPPSRPDFWLLPLKRKPVAFEPRPADDEPPDEVVLPLQVRFSWKSREASVRWDGIRPSPPLVLCGTGGPLGPSYTWPSREWQQLDAAVAEGLATELTSTSILTVRADDGRESPVLVQEEDMPLKPELLRTLPVRDILQYWSLLKPEQRQAFLDSRAEQLSPNELGGLMAPVADDARLGNDIFERCAGVFHAFAQLEARVFEALEAKRPRQAAALMFGERFDSLGTVLDRVLRGDDAPTDSGEMDEVDRYLVLLCAVQLTERIRKDAPDFWEDYRAQAEGIAQRLRERTMLRTALTAQDPAEMPTFLDWFDTWFLKRAEPVERL
jgi:hypothetical protein